MSPFEAGLILAWIAILILAAALAGLVVRHAELRRLHDQLTRTPPNLEIFVTKALRDGLGIREGAFAALIADRTCGSCVAAFKELQNLSGALADVDLRVVLAERQDAEFEDPGGRIVTVVDPDVWGLVPGTRPVLAVAGSTAASVRFVALDGPDDLHAALAGIIAQPTVQEVRS
ncbi:hypothetical protein [Nonomuraea sp. SBT364]|uniref:hypothetical protein n=1 Tax=Nonomuraea sp. SBT364 TaxID=1580530 RepID=UPI00066BFBFC|nr:hypothetical protein [Nonomuraea sp. SBT364]